MVHGTGTDATARVNYFHMRGPRGSRLRNSCNTPIVVFDVRDNDLGSAEFVLGLQHKNLLTCYCFDDDRERERLSECNTKSGEQPAKNGDGEKLTGDKKSANKGEKSANDELKPANNAEKANKNEPSKENTDWSRPFHARGLYHKFDRSIYAQFKKYKKIQTFFVPSNGKSPVDRHGHQYVIEPVRNLIREMVTFLLDLHMKKLSLAHFTFEENVVVVGNTPMFVNLVEAKEHTAESNKANMSAFLTELMAYFPSYEATNNQGNASEATEKPEDQPVPNEVPFDIENFLELLSCYDGHPKTFYHIQSKHISLLSSEDRLRAIENYTRKEAFLSSRQKILFRNARRDVTISENVDWPHMFADKNHAYGKCGVFGPIWECYEKHQNILQKEKAEAGNSIRTYNDLPQDELIRFCRHLTAHLPQRLYHHYTGPEKKAAQNRLTEEAVDLTIMAGFGKELLSFQYELHRVGLLSKFV